MASSPERRGFLRNAVEAFIEARQRQAQLYVNDVLRSLDRQAPAEQVRSSIASKRRSE
jgi:hypothetical protein